MAIRQGFSNSNGDTVDYQPNSNKPVNASNENANESQNWNQSHIDGIIDFMINDMLYNGHVGYKCQGITGQHPNYVYSAIQQYPNAGGDLSPFLLSNGGLHPSALDQIQSNILNLCESGGVPDTHQALECTSCPVETIIEGVDSKGRDIMVQGCEYFNNTNKVSRVKENGTWYNIGIPSIYHNMPMYPGGCSSYQPSSNGGVSSGSVSSGTTRPIKAKSKKNNKMRDNRNKEIGKACKKCDSLRLKYGKKSPQSTRKLSASGCGCGSSFSGDKKPCSCGRNPGGSCQCNSGGSSDLKLTSEKKYLNLPNNSSAKKYDQVKFSNFMASVKPKKQMNFVNPSKYGAGEDDIFAFNPRVVEQFSTNSKSFFDKADLDNYSF